MEKELIDDINTDWSIDLPQHIELKELQDKLAVHINQLIQNNFERLVTLLYRIDVYEQKLKYLLKLHADEDAGHIIAGLIIERQLQKIKSRKEFLKNENDIPEEDKW